jgi:RimJ/RimL family protein N-acetyltransferase
MLTTSRLLLRQWRDDDLDDWAALNADPSVREFFDGVLTRDEALGSMTYFRDTLASRGWGWWAIEVRETGRLAGMAGLDPVDEEVPFDGVEIGWRLARWAWGRGYATEAARAVVAYAFETLRLPEILSIAAVGNLRSHAVMKKLGMVLDREFDNMTEPPAIRRNVLCRVPAPRTTGLSQP